MFRRAQRKTVLCCGRGCTTGSQSRRLAKAAPRQTLCWVHAGNEREKQFIGRAQASIAETYETTRCEGDNPGSCFVLGYKAHDGAGWQASGSDAAMHYDGCELWRSPWREILWTLFPWKMRNSAQRTLTWRETSCTITKASWAFMIKAATWSQFAPPSLPCAPLPLLLLLYLKGLLHCGPNLILQPVVVVGKVLAGDL